MKKKVWSSLYLLVLLIPIILTGCALVGPNECPRPSLEDAPYLIHQNPSYDWYDVHDYILGNGTVSFSRYWEDGIWYDETVVIGGSFSIIDRTQADVDACKN